MRIEYSRKAIKYINSLDKPTKRRLREAIEKFVPEEPPEPDEIAAIEEGRRDREKNGTIPHEAINWG